MNLPRVILALLSLNQDYVSLNRLHGMMELADRYPATRLINKGSFRRAIIKEKAAAIVYHDKILNGAKTLKVGINEDHPLAPPNE